MAAQPLRDPVQKVRDAGGAFALGSVAASAFSGRLAHRAPRYELRLTFGRFLIVSGFGFTLDRLVAR